MRGSRGVTGGPPPPEKPQKYRVYYQYCCGFPENHKATKATFNAGPSWARQRNANVNSVSLALYSAIWFHLPPHQKKKKKRLKNVIIL